MKTAKRKPITAKTKEKTKGKIRRWDIKGFHQLIVLSAPYRQSSELQVDLVGRDPENTLLAKQVRLRLDAEIVRDASLAAGGLL